MHKQQRQINTFMQCSNNNPDLNIAKSSDAIGQQVRGSYTRYTTPDAIIMPGSSSTEGQAVDNRISVVVRNLSGYDTRETISDRVERSSSQLKEIDVIDAEEMALGHGADVNDVS